MGDHWRDVGREVTRRFEPPERYWEPSIPEADTFIQTRIGGFRPGFDVDLGRRWLVDGASLAYRRSLGHRVRSPGHRPGPPSNPFRARQPAPGAGLREFRPPARVRSLTERLTIRPDATPGIGHRRKPADRQHGRTSSNFRIDWSAWRNRAVANPRTMRDVVGNLKVHFQLPASNRHTRPSQLPRLRTPVITRRR